MEGELPPKLRMESGVWPGPNPQEETPPVGEGGGRRKKRKTGDLGTAFEPNPQKPRLGDARKG